MKTLKYLLIPLILLAAITAVLINNRTKIQAKSVPRISDVNYVSVEKVSKRNLSEEFSLVGTVAANNDVNIVSETQGKVTGVFVKVGDYKPAGSILFQIDDELKKAALMSAEAAYEKAKKDYERFLELHSQKSASDSQLDAAKLAKANAEAQYIIANKQYNDTKITTPISGYVTARYADLGVMVQNNSVVANVVDISKVKVKVNVAEEDVFKLKTGDEVKVTTDVYPGITFKGRIETISAKGDDAHTYPVEVSIINEKNHELKAGMFARVSFNNNIKSDVLTIPREALLGSVKDAEVYVVDGDNAKLVKLVLGQETGTRVQVLQGLKEGDNVIVSGQNNLTDGSKIEIVQ